MKKISSVISLSFVVLFLLVFLFPSICFSEQPNSKEWEYYGKDNYGRIYYYNKTNITKSSDIISIQNYTIDSEDSKRIMVERWKNIDTEKSLKYQHYDHTIFMDEFDCKKKLTRRNEYIWYDDKGNVLDKYKKENSEWKNIVPDSVSEELYKRVCVTPKEPLKKK
jgi:hypothetical protein